MTAYAKGAIQKAARRAIHFEIAYAQFVFKTRCEFGYTLKEPAVDSIFFVHGLSP
jgi:hypothetical protein